MGKKPYLASHGAQVLCDYYSMQETVQDRIIIPSK